MTEFENVLEQCLLDLDLGVSNVDECLGRHPGHAQQLKPVLLTHASLERFGEVRPSAAFKARVRAKLTQGMQAHPRKSSRFNFAFMQLAGNFAVALMIFLMVGTAYAQRSLPGEAFYEWKLTSENVWRAVSSDPVKTDLAIAKRRMNELMTVSNDPVLQPHVLNAYLEVTARLMSEIDAENEALILQMLDTQAEELREAGIVVPPILDEEVLPPVEEILPTLVDPIETLLPLTETPDVNPTLPVATPSAPEVVPPLRTELPPANPTDLPEIIPTIRVSTLLP